LPMNRKVRDMIEKGRFISFQLGKEEGLKTKTRYARGDLKKIYILSGDDKGVIGLKTLLTQKLMSNTWTKYVILWGILGSPTRSYRPTKSKKGKRISSARRKKTDLSSSGEYGSGRLKKGALCRKERRNQSPLRYYKDRRIRI